MDDRNDLTGLINRAFEGDAEAAEAAFRITYDDLCRLARQRLQRGARGSTLDTATVVHEAFLRFVGVGQMRMEDRQHFMRYASRVMRSVIVDTIRSRAADRRGGDLQQVTLTGEVAGELGGGEAEVLDVHAALEALAERDARMTQIVEMRYFAGMTEVEVAAALGITDRTVRRTWQRARVWLADALQ